MEKNEQQLEDPRRNAPSQALRPLCIVVADDDRDAVLSLMMLLRDEGHETHGAYTAQQAQDACLKFGPDALILDIALGQSSGYDVARRVRLRHGEDQPVIIGVSGIYRKGPDRILAEINGFNHYLVKPYEASELLALLAPLRAGRATPKQREQIRQEDTYRAAVVRAATLVGGVRELSNRIQVSMPDLTRWLEGKGTPPIGVFLRIVDIFLEETKKVRMELTSGKVIELPKTPEPE